MNVIKEYNTAKKKKGNVAFGATGGARWNFRISDKESGAWTKIMRVSGGFEIAAKVADVISKSWIRTAGKKLESFARIDAAARRQIDYLTGLRTLKDWEGEPEWWSNQSRGTPTVEMVYIKQRKATPPAPVSPEDLGIPDVEIGIADTELVLA